MLTFKEFQEFYCKYKRCPNDAGRRRSQPMNERQLRTRYEQYKKSIQYKEIVFDQQWEEIRNFVLQRDRYSCQFYSVLIPELQDELHKKAGYFFEIIDPAHVLSRSAYPKLKYDSDNIVALNRYSHTMLDSHRHPITSEPLTVEEVSYWWIQILGREKYTFLMQKSRKNSIIEE